jgi:hypothetical protein
MKQLICLIAFIGALSVNMYAQSAPPFPQGAKHGQGATITNAANDTLTFSITNFTVDVAAFLNLIKTSGTVAGVAYVQASNDSTNSFPGQGWVNPFSINGVVSVGADSVTLTNVATQSFNWNLSPRIIGTYQKYRIIVACTGTQVSVPYAYFKYTVPYCGR